MKASFLLLVCLLSILLAGCGDEYSGEYLHLITRQQAYIQDVDGKVYHPSSRGGRDIAYREYFRSKATGKGKVKNSIKTIYKMDLEELLLSIKQDRTRLTGTMTWTNDRDIAEFEIKHGYVDENNIMHMKLVKQSDTVAGVSLGPFSLEGKPSKLILNFDQVAVDHKNSVMFRVSMATKVLSVSEKTKDDTTVFTKVENNREKVKQQWIAKYIAEELTLISEYLDSGDTKNARLHKDLLISLGGTVGTSLEERLSQSE